MIDNFKSAGNMLWGLVAVLTSVTPVRRGDALTDEETRQPGTLLRGGGTREGGRGRKPAVDGHAYAAVAFRRLGLRVFLPLTHPADFY